MRLPGASLELLVWMGAVPAKRTGCCLTCATIGRSKQDGYKLDGTVKRNPAQLYFRV